MVLLMRSTLPDFDTLVHLAKTNPDELEQLRIRLCNDLIERAPEASRRRLRGIQFQIDMERRKADNPMAACIRISQMMHDSFERMRLTLNEAVGNAPSLSTPQAKFTTQSHSTKILKFPSR